MGDAIAWRPSAAVPETSTSVQGAKRTVDAALFCELVEQHHAFIWRLLRQLGIPEADVDDATQQVFMVLAQRKDLQIVVGSERAFLFGVALKVARTQKRSRARRRESSAPPPELSDPELSPDALIEQRQARRVLDEILESMPIDLRIPFVLFELDDMATAEIAELLSVPAGTVASRLRRAREWFERRVEQRQARHTSRGLR